ncbi:hypothetical protein [Catellatospora vulcania]|uniref:hypothetical protein n=1 Tax=Catellatospora vulcania TaxID=1460450 RepID=UPI0012D49B7F|nr:hypothetical protein [Catellatospora vulcania]
MYLFDADSIVVSTANELLRTHRPVSVEDQSCANCGQPAPCDAATNARQIQAAASLAGESAG